MTLSKNTSSNLTRQSLRKPIFCVYWKEEPHKMARDPLGGEIITTRYRDTPLTGGYVDVLKGNHGLPLQVVSLKLCLHDQRTGVFNSQQLMYNDIPEQTHQHNRVVLQHMQGICCRSDSHKNSIKSVCILGLRDFCIKSSAEKGFHNLKKNHLVLAVKAMSHCSCCQSNVHSCM